VLSPSKNKPIFVKELNTMSIKAVGVIGAGVMGRGLSQDLAQKGFQVILVDVSKDILERARQAIKDGIRFQTLFSSETTGDSFEDIFNRVLFTIDLKELSNIDFAIENVTERWDVKEKLFRLLDKICPKHSVFASNTSAIPITQLASVTERASKVIGMHFMNPVPMKSLVEIIPGTHTSDETVECAKELLTQMGKEGIVVKDSPGFVSNRVLMLTINEAIYLLHENVASVEDIDKIFKQCFGHKMGPLETADLIGLDTILNSIEVLGENINDEKYRPCLLLINMVQSGLLGQKSGKGFYDYPVSK